MTAPQPRPDNSFNRQFGLPVARIENKVKATISDAVKDFIRESPFIVKPGPTIAG